MGFENAVSMPVKVGLSFKGETAPLIVSIPNMSTAKPNRMLPIVFFLEPSLYYRVVVFIAHR
jgi:hypothetical protein